MDEDRLRELLLAVAHGARSVEEATADLRDLPYKDLGFAQVDHHRQLRQGFPEVVLGAGKTAEQIAAILTELSRGGGNLLATRVSAEKAELVLRALPRAHYDAVAEAIVVKQRPIAMRGRGTVLVICAGTSDLKVAEEAALTAELRR